MEYRNGINDFLSELKNSLQKTSTNIDNNIFNEKCDELKIEKSNKKQVVNLIKHAMVEYSYDTDFIYINYDKKSSMYYINYYDGEITKK